MDRDEYFRILDDASCFNLENFFFDKEWANMGALAHVQSEREDENAQNSEKNEGFDNVKKILKKDKNALKMLE
jgi:hypothetical protein